MLMIMMGIVELHQPVTMRPINPTSPSLINPPPYYDSFVSSSSNSFDYSEAQRAAYIHMCFGALHVSHWRSSSRMLSYFVLRETSKTISTPASTYYEALSLECEKPYVRSMYASQHLFYTYYGLARLNPDKFIEMLLHSSQKIQNK